jgi:hypothetical protein
MRRRVDGGVRRVVGDGVVGHTENREPSLRVAVLLEGWRGCWTYT